MANLLTERTEGWAAGIQLATLILQTKGSDIKHEHIFSNFNGGHRHIQEYLRTEVLDAQPEPLQTFLLQTSFLKRLTASLCNAVTGHSSSNLLLDQVEHARLFLVPIDEERQWYRYHSLFAEAMQHEARRRFRQDEITSLSQAATSWYEQENMRSEAIECALAAEAFELAADIIERHAAGVFQFQGIEEMTTLRRWLETLPPQVVATRASLCFAQALALLFSCNRRAPSTYAMVEASLQKAEQVVRTEKEPQMPDMIVALRSLLVGWQGDFEQVFALSHQALALFPVQEMQWHGISLLHVGKEALLKGWLNEAHELFTTSKACCHATNNTFALLATTIALGDVCFARGELRQARRHYQHISLFSAEKWPAISDSKHPARDDHAQALIGLAQLSYEWNELDRAEQQVSEGLTIATQLQEEHLLIAASIVLARILQARGELTHAQQLLQERCTSLSSSWLQNSVLLEQTWLALLAGDHVLAEHTLAIQTRHTERIAHLEQERHALLVARLQIAQGHASEALASLQFWLGEAKAMGRTRSEIQLLSNMALLHMLKDEHEQAHIFILQAVQLAYPEKHYRIFLDEGEQIFTLLRKTLSFTGDESIRAYIRSLLTASENFSTPHAIHPLSPRELHVLQLLIEGYSRTQIAQELVFSINTIKTHLHSIYHNLHVTNRKEAYASAKRLNLL